MITPAPAPALHEDRWLRTAEVAERLGIHLNTLARYISVGQFGKVLILSARDKRISSSAVDRWISSRLA